MEEFVRINKEGRWIDRYKGKEEVTGKERNIEDENIWRKTQNKKSMRKRTRGRKEGDVGVELTEKAEYEKNGKG